MNRLLQSTSGTITLIIRDADGVAMNADALVTATVYDSADVQVATGLATKRADTTGIYDFLLTQAQTATLDRYRTTWTCMIAANQNTFTTRHEVVGAFLFTIADLRDRFSELTAAKYPSDRVRSARDAVEERFEERKGNEIAFRPRGRRVILDGPGGDLLTIGDLYPRTIVSASIDGVALDAGELAEMRLIDAGFIRRPDGKQWTAGLGNIEILYEYGLDAPPEPITDAALILAKHLLIRSPLGERATSETTELGTFRIATAGRDGATGLPEVDAILDQFGVHRPVVA